MSRSVHIESMKSLPGAPSDREILSMIEAQDGLAYAFVNVQPDDELMRTCHEALVMAGLKAEK